MVSKRAIAALVGLIFASVAVFVIALSRPSITAQTQGEVASEPDVDGSGEDSAEINPHVNDQPDPVQQTEIWAVIEKNRAQLREQGILPMGGDRIVGFDLPLKTAQPSDVQPWFIANHVDHNFSFPNARLDYHCGTRTYDSAGGYNHKGTDFFLWPLPWKQMDEGNVHVVAAAPAVIVHKQDGNYDRHCTITGSTWNAVYVEHADGSIGWYGHLKSGSLTTKNVGDTLARGEYIGLVGSSGNSTGPHLHFEVYDESNELIDPFSGSCNVMNDRSWWLYQEPYELPSITGIVIGTQNVDATGCGIAERTFEQESYAPNSQLTFTLYYRDRASNLTADVRLLKPDGSVHTTWAHTDSGDYWNATYTYAARTIGPEQGTWTYEVTYNNSTYSKQFVVGGRNQGFSPTAVTVRTLNAQADIQIGPLALAGATLIAATTLASATRTSQLCLCQRGNTEKTARLIRQPMQVDAAGKHR